MSQPPNLFHTFFDISMSLSKFSPLLRAGRSWGALGSQEEFLETEKARREYFSRGKSAGRP